MGMLIDGAHVHTLIKAKDTLLLFLMTLYVYLMRVTGYECQKLMLFFVIQYFV